MAAPSAPPADLAAFSAAPPSTAPPIGADQTVASSAVSGFIDSAIRADSIAPEQTPIPELTPSGAALGSDPVAAANTPAPIASAPELTPGGSPGPTPSGTGGVSGALELPDPGATVNHYELIRELGRGGMGAVFLARDTKLGRRVAIKFLHSDNAEVAVRFQMEAKITAQLNHENIVTIYESGDYGRLLYMVLEFLQGKPLSDEMGANNRLPPSRVVELMVPVVRGLQIAHQRKIVHRDLKPDNIYITDSGTVKVLDFGIAKLKGHDIGVAEIVQKHHPELLQGRASTKDTLVEHNDTSSTELTKAGAIMGTLAYMSPEQWGVDEVDHRTDIWALGIIMYRMLTGRHPLAPMRGWQLMCTAQLDEPMPSIRDVAVDIPEGLANIIDRCLLKDKAQRMPDAETLLQELEQHLPGRFTRKLSLDVSPYAGLSAFQESDADRFFGRSREISSMATRLRDRPLIGVVGPSGVGKSSFVRAGVVPALKQSGEQWETLVVRPGRSPLAALANVLTPLISESTTTVVDDVTELQNQLQRLYVEPGYLGSVLRSQARRKNRKIMLFVDQFEELYTMNPDPRERMAFTTCLAGVADDATTPLRVVVSIRSDFLDRVAEDPYFLAELSQGFFFLAPPNRDGLRDALIEPAKMAGYEFENSDMVENMLDHLQTTPGALPLLQFAASKLWEARDSGRRLLTQHSYDSMGGIAGALASHADAVLQEMSPQAQALARAIFLRLITPERTRAIVPIMELYELSQYPAEVQRVVDTLVNARLLTMQGGEHAEGASVEIVHESLVHSWPLLRLWLDENQDDAAFLDQLRNASKQWQQRGQPSGLLWRGEAMEEARRWHKRYKGQLTGTERAYLDAVFSLAVRATRVKRAVIAGVIGFLTLGIVAAVFALVFINGERSKATEARDEAKTQATIAEENRQEALARLEQVKKKEQERAAAAMEAQVAMERANKAAKAVNKANAKLQGANVELLDALGTAEEQKQRARKARAAAEENAEAAVAAQLEAQIANEELTKTLDRERKRIEELLEQLGGSDIVEDLK